VSISLFFAIPMLCYASNPSRHLTYETFHHPFYLPPPTMPLSSILSFPHLIYPVPFPSFPFFHSPLLSSPHTPAHPTSLFSALPSHPIPRGLLARAHPPVVLPSPPARTTPSIHPRPSSSSRPPRPRPRTTSRAHIQHRGRRLERQDAVAASDASDASRARLLEPFQREAPMKE